MSPHQPHIDKLRTDIEILDRRINHWTDRTMPAYRRTINQKQILQTELVRLLEKQRALGKDEPEKSKTRLLTPRRLIVAQNPTMEHRGLCDLFDYGQITLPRTMSEAAGWAKAYHSKIYRPRIQVIISKDRQVIQALSIFP